MRGIDLMLMGIYAVNYITDLKKDDDGYITNNLPKHYDWEVSLDKANVSLAEVNAAKGEPPLPKKIRVTTWTDYPYSYINKTTGKGDGLAFYLFNEINRYLELEYEIVMPKLDIIGDARTGMIQLLNEKKVDMAVAMMPIIPEFNEYCDFSTIIDTLDITVLLKRPLESAVGSGLLAPFSTTVWICILVSLIVFGPAIFAITQYRSKLFNNTKEDVYSFTSCVWFTYGALLKQGSPIIPVNDSIRLLFAAWWLFITILTSFYTANLTAFLTLSEYTLDITDLNSVVAKRQPWSAATHKILEVNLANKQERTLDGLRASYYRDIGRFVTIGLDEHNDILREVQQDRLYFGHRERNEKIITRDYLEKTKANLPQNKRCIYIEMPNPIFQQNRGFAFPKGSPLRDKIDEKLLRMVDMGIIKHLETWHMPEVKYCPLNLKSTERQLSNNDLSLTYKVIGSGFILSILMFIVEMFQRCCNCEGCLCCADACRACHNRLIIPVEQRSNMVVSNDQKRRPAIMPPPPRYPSSVKLPSPPQLPFRMQASTYSDYESVYNNPYNYINRKRGLQTHMINGQPYVYVNDSDGMRRLVPVRSPSALLFQYTS